MISIKMLIFGLISSLESVYTIQYRNNSLKQVIFGFSCFIIDFSHLSSTCDPTNNSAF